MSTPFGAVPNAKPLGHYRDKSLALYGLDSPCTAWLDQWISALSEGREYLVNADEGTVFSYMERVHQGLPTKPVIVPPTGN